MGGRLIQSTANNLYSYEKDYGSDIVLCYALFFFGGIAAFIGRMYLLSRDDKRAKFHGKIIIGICLGSVLLILLVLVIVSLLH